MSSELTTLSNGFRIVSEAMPGLKSATVGIWIGAGSRNEHENQTGIAHFLEHMAFKGTSRRSSFEIAEAIENVGGHINAYTSKEVTAYYAQVLEDDLPLALDVLADILRGPLFCAEDIEAERGVILQEIGQVLDTPDDVIFDWLQEAAYPEQAMGRSILGPPERIKVLGRSDLKSFVEQYYVPSNMILSAAGAVDHGKIVALAEGFFGDMQKRKITACAGAKFASGERRELKELKQAHFALALPSVHQRDQDVYTAQIYALALGGGMSSRLFQEIREKRGLCYSVFAHTTAYSDTGTVSVYAGTGPEQLGELVDLTLTELRRISEDFSAPELDRVRAQIKAGSLMALERPLHRAERLARLLSIWGYVPPLEDIIARIDAVDLEMVKRFSEARCTDGRLALALYGCAPLGDLPRLEVLSERLAV